MIRTLMVEANPVARLGIRAILGVHTDALEIDEAGSHDELLAKLRERYYEFMIVEPTIVGPRTGTALVARLRELSPWSDILVYTALDELSFGIEAIRNGAKGYLMKTATRDELRTAVRRVASGRLYLSKALADEFACGMQKHDARKKLHERLSKRERQVFSLAVCGTTVAESAHLLHLKEETVSSFKRSVMHKLQATTPQALVDYAAAHGLEADCRATCSGLWSGRYEPHQTGNPMAFASVHA